MLENIDLTVRKGEFVSIIGPSGCGKSTILKLVAGLAPVTSGTLLVDGMTPVNAREIVSFIFQDPTLLPWRTVAKNVGLALELDHSPRDTRPERDQCAARTRRAELMWRSPIRGSSPAA